MKRLDWFEIILILVVLGVSLFAVTADAQNFSWRWFTRDDAYYYFKVAQNISEGHGSTFDGINRTNGYHPLWMLISVPIFALARFDLILPLRVLFLVMSGLSLATGILLYRLVGRIFAPVVGAFAALYWVFSVNVVIRFYKQGLETGIAALLVVLFVYKLYEFERAWRVRPVTRRDLIVLGVIGALVIFSRLDLVFLVAFAGLWLVFRGSPLRYLLPLDMVSIAFSVLLAFVIRTGFPDYYELANVAATTLAVSLVIKIPFAYLFGLYQREKLGRLRDLFLNLILFVGASSAVLLVVMLVIARVQSFIAFPRIVILYDAIATFILLLLPRLLAAGLKTANATPSEKQSPIGVFLRNWKGWLVDGLWYYGVAFGALGLYMLWSRFAFGTFSPVSGQIKRWWGSLSGRVYGGSAKNFQSFFGVSYSGDSNAWHPLSTMFGNWAERWQGTYMQDVYRYAIIITVFAVIVYCLLLINRNKAKTAIAGLGLIPLFSGAFFQIFYYHMLGYSAYKEWYWVIQMVLIVLVFSLMVGMLYTAFRRVQWFKYLAWGLAAVYGLFLFSSYWTYIQSNMTHGEWAADEPFMDISAFLEEHTEPGSIIGMTGGGNAAYFIRNRTVVNMDGLINSHEYFELLKDKQAGPYLADIGMNYVLANIQILDSLPYRGQYAKYLVKTGLRYGGKELARYGAPQPQE